MEKGIAGGRWGDGETGVIHNSYFGSFRLCSLRQATSATLSTSQGIAVQVTHNS